MRPRRLTLGALLVTSAAVGLVEACGDTSDIPPASSTPDATTGSGPDSGSPPTDGGGPLLDAPIGPLPSAITCPGSCAEIAASSACVGKNFREAGCVEYCPCVNGAFRPEIQRAVLTCGAGCRDGGEDNCIAVESSAYATDPDTVETVRLCDARHRECRAADASLGADVCAVIGARPELLARLRSCLVVPCPDGRACVAKVFDDFGCGK